MNREIHKSIENNNSSDDEDDQESSDMELEEEEVAPNESFFAASKQKSITSNATLQFQEMSHQDFMDALQKGPKTHAHVTGKLVGLYKLAFPQWYFEVSQGFNLLFYGYGSKLDLLTLFVKKYLCKGNN